MTDMLGALGEGLTETSKYMREKPERDLRYQEAKNRQKLSTMKLEEYGQNAANRKEAAELELEQLRGTVRTMQRNDYQSNMDRYMDTWMETRDVEPLNKFLGYSKGTQFHDTMVGDVVRVDPTSRTPEVEAYVRATGIENVDAFFADPNMASSLVLATSSTGEQKIMNIRDHLVESGYATRAYKKNLDILHKEATIQSLLSTPAGKETDMGKAIAAYMEEHPDKTYSEAIEWYKSQGKREPQGTGFERERERIVAERKAKGLPPLDQEELARATNDRLQYTQTEQEIDLANKLEAELEKVDFSNPEERKKNATKVSQFLRAIKREIPKDVKKEIRELLPLFHMGTRAAETLSDADTGIIDNMTYNVKKYFSDDVSGIDGRFAYENFKGLLRHDLFGATLTGGEKGAMDSLLSSLGTKKGPILKQMKEQLLGIKNKLEVIADMEHPIATAYYLGMSDNDVNLAITRLNNRISQYDDAINPSDPGDTVPIDELNEKIPADGTQEEAPRPPIGEAFKAADWK